MTNDEAIKILQGAIKKPNTKDGYLGQAIGMAVKALEQQPRWIPVSERLPENRKEVVVFLSSGEITIGKYNEHKLPFSDYPIGWGYPDKRGYIDFTKENVIAWMPLPPYEELEE